MVLGCCESAKDDIVVDLEAPLLTDRRLSPTVLEQALAQHRRVRRQRLRQFCKCLALTLFAALLAILGVVLGYRLYVKSHPDAANGQDGSINKYPVEGRHGAVASEHPQCSEIGLDMLKRGGSAVDAVIASGLCIGTINSFSSGIGGGGFMLVRDPTGTSRVFDFRETAPAAANKTMYDSRPKASELGGLAVAVPGELSGYWNAHQRYGRLNWSVLFEPSITIARTGFNVSRLLIEKLNDEREHVLADEGMRAVFAPTGDLVKEGQLITRPNYADTLQQIAMGGVQAFYTGAIAQSLVDLVQRKGGIMTMDDLAQYQAKLKDPVTGWYKGRKLITAPLPASGPVLISILNILEKYNFGSHDGSRKSIDDVHHLIEAIKFGYAQRTEMGDTDFLDMEDRLAEIMSKDYAAAVRANITGKTHPVEYYNPVYDTVENHGTTHVNALDENDMAASMTSTVNLYFGARIMDPVTGIILNDEMDDFSLPNKTNYFGLRPSPANFIVPGKKPLSSSVPTIIETDGRVELIAGASGGSKIITATLQLILNVLDWHMNVQQAINAPRLHHQLVPNEVWMEEGYGEWFRSELREKRGHEVVQLSKKSTLACVHAIQKLPDGLIQAGADPRKDSKAAAY